MTYILIFIINLIVNSIQDLFCNEIKVFFIIFDFASFWQEQWREMQHLASN